MPTLYILAGPNGAGKSTFYYTAVEEGFISESLPFINIDILTKQLGGYTETNYIRAEEIYRELVGKLISANQDFMIESNLAKETEYQWIEKLKLKGYEVVLYYLCTDYPDEIHVQRVQMRVAEGGHDVPAEIVRHRYQMSLLYLKTKLPIFKEVYLIDNEETARQMILLRDGVVIKREATIPQWVLQAISIIERLGQGKKNL